MKWFRSSGSLLFGISYPEPRYRHSVILQKSIYRVAKRLADEGVNSPFGVVRNLEIGFRRKESGDRRQETGERNQDSGFRKQDSGNRRQEMGFRNQETGIRIQETGDMLREPFDPVFG